MACLWAPCFVRRQILFPFFSSFLPLFIWGAASDSLRADSKFAHQPVSFQCEVKNYPILHGLALWRWRYSAACCGAKKCNSVQTRDASMKRWWEPGGWWGLARRVAISSKQGILVCRPSPSLSCGRAQPGHAQALRSRFTRADLWEFIDRISSICGEYYEMMRTS